MTKLKRKRTMLLDTNNYKRCSYLFIDAAEIILKKLLTCSAVDISKHSSKKRMHWFKRRKLFSFNINKPYLNEVIKNWARLIKMQKTFLLIYI